MLVTTHSIGRADDSYTLREAGEGQVSASSAEISVSGTLEFAVDKEKALRHPISAEAKLSYRERRLSGAGRDAEALRSLRAYDSLESKIKVAEHVSASRLRPDRRMIVAGGRREGIQFYSPNGPLAASELELLRAPGDSLCLVALLPSKAVAVGETWSPPAWAIQMLADVEAASKNELTCKLASVDGDLAKIEFQGAIEGATAGSTSSIQIKGGLTFDRKAERIAEAEIEQAEKRTVGTISPGMQVTAKAKIKRAPAMAEPDLTDVVAATVSLDPPSALLMLRFRSPWNIEFDHDRRWHVFQQSEQIAVLRYVDGGIFIAQCNLAPIRRAQPGHHVTAEQFQADIRTSLGERMKSIEKAEVLPAEEGRYTYRVITLGEVNKVPVNWIYYLCAAPDGQQVSLVFAVESKLREQLADRDLQLVKSLRFVEAAKTP